MAQNGEARVEVRDSVLQTEGLQDPELPQASAVRVVNGPRGGMEGVLSAATTAAVEGRLAEPLRDSGSLMFWFRTDRAYRTGTAAEPSRIPLIELPGAVTVSFLPEKQTVTMLVEWAGDPEIMKTRHIRIQLPEFPGPEWHHFALVWHRKNGETNAYLDGTPYFIPGKNIQPLPVPDAAAVRVPLGRIALADVRIGAHVFVAEELPGSLGADARRLDRLIGAAELPAFPARDSRGPLLFESRLAETGDIAAWKLEGPGEITFADGWMEMRSARPEGPEGHFVLWAPAEFPTDFQAEWEFEILQKEGLCIVFFCARGGAGQDVFDPSLAARHGVFSQYTSGDINNYHISYFANAPGSPRPVANLRKNSGFHLVSNGPVGVSPADGIGPGLTHNAILLKRGNRVRMAVDGKTIIDFEDDGKRAGPVLGGGKIGFRQMQWTVARYRNFRVFALP